MSGAKNPYEVLHDNLIFLKNFGNGPKIGFLNLKKNLVSVSQELTDFFACWYKFMQVNRTLKILGVENFRGWRGQKWMWRVM